MMHRFFKRWVEPVGIGLMLGLLMAGLTLALIVLPYQSWKRHAFREECDALKGFVYHDSEGQALCLTSNWKIIAVIR